MTATISFKRVLLVCVLMLACIFCFAACNGKTFTDNPESDDLVQGNGGMAVTKGDYVYYVNGFTSYEDVGETNHDGNITYAGLYRTKLVNGEVVENEPEYDDDGNEIFDETQGIQYTDLLVSKVCGFEYMGIYIFGDYIYYTTPNNQKAGDLTVRSDLIDFCRTKLDRSSGQEVLYTTTNPGDSVSYSMYELDGVVYQIIMDGTSSTDTSKIVINTINNNRVSRFTTSDEMKVTSYAETNYTASNQQIADLDKDVYFTYTNDDISGYTALAKLELGSNTITTLINDNNSTFSLLGSVGGNLYYTKSTSTAPGSTGAYLYYNSLKSTNFFDSEYKLTANAYNQYILYTEGLGVGSLVYDSTNNILYKKTGNSGLTQVMSGTTISSVIGIYGNYLYFISSSNVYRIDFVNGGTATSLTANDGTINSESGDYVAIVGNMMFYLKQYSNDNSTAYYLHMKNFNITDPDTGAYYDHFIGVLAEADYLVDESAESDTESESSTDGAIVTE